MSEGWGEDAGGDRIVLTSGGGRRHEALVAGDPGAPVALLVHGFPDLPQTWREQLPALAAAGYRAVAPILRGYSPEARAADGRYDVGALADDVLAWLGALGARQAHVIGHDWGAVAAYAAAARAPERVATLTALAVPPLSGLARAMVRKPRRLAPLDYMAMFQLAGVGEWALARDDFAMIDALWARWSPGYEADVDEREAIKAAFRVPGTAQAALAYYRQLGSLWRPRTIAAHRLLQRPIRVPTLVVYGDQDGCLPPDVYPEALAPQAFPRGIVLRILYGAGHFLHLERPGVLNAWLLEHLGRGIDGAAQAG